MTVLAEFIEREVDAIVDEWEEFAQTSVPAARQLSSVSLRDHARVLLLAVVADLRASESGDNTRAKSRGELPDNSPQLTATAQAHARHRFEQGFSLDEMVSEVRALRASVLRRWLAANGTCDRQGADEIVRFGAAMDQALTAAVSWFSARVDESRSLLLGVLGHDLRTPLGAIRLSAQYLQRSGGLDGRQSDAAERILRSSNNIRAMAEDILSFTKIALGLKLPLAREPCDLEALCREVVAELSAAHPSRELHLACTGDLAGRYDAGRIRQLLSNVIGNALQHGTPGTPVNVTADGLPGEVCVAVHNEGPPIPPEVRNVLFRPVAHAGGGSGRRHQDSSGLSLGLYIAREIALAHQGRIELESTEAAGTTFTVQLPR
jgi:signal transduction histidine kinase